MSDAIPPDDKDWTWVLQRPCPECGFEPASVDLDDVPKLARANAGAWREVLGRADATVDPAHMSGLRSNTPAMCATCSACTTSAWH